MAIDPDGPGRYIDQDGLGRYIDQDSPLGWLFPIRKIRCVDVTPPTACGVGTVIVDGDTGYLIDPDGGGWYVDQDGTGRYIDQDDRIAAPRACLLGELEEVIEAGN